MSNGWDEMATVGRVARTHGNRGHVILHPETDFPERRFQVGRVLYAQRAAASCRSRLMRSGSTAAARSLAFGAW